MCRKIRCDEKFEIFLKNLELNKDLTDRDAVGVTLEGS